MIQFLMKRIFLIGISVILCGILIAVLRDSGEISGGVKLEGGSFIEDLRILHRKSGTVDWTLTAKRADFLDNSEKARLKDIRMQIQKDGVSLFADSGTYDLATQSFTTDEMVQAEGDDYTIRADSIQYDISSGTIRTDGTIHVDGKGFTIQGKGLQADKDQKVHILNDVKATFQK